MNLSDLLSLNSRSRLKIEHLHVFYFISCLLIVLSLQKIQIEWKWAHVFFNYEYGFLKRGLLGELFRKVGIPTTYDNFMVFSSLMMTFLVLAYYQVIKNMQLFFGFIFVGLFVTSPLFLKNLVHDWGRFDQLAITYLFISIVVLTDRRFDKFSSLLVGLSPVLLFIHEATILWFFPVFFIFVYLEKPRWLLYLIPACGVSFLLLLIAGNLKVSAQDYYELLSQWSQPHWIHPAIVNTLTNSLSDSLHMSIPAIVPNLVSKQGVIGVVELALTFGLLIFVRSSKLIFLTFLALLVASILFMVALDHFRWMSLMGFIILSVFIYSQKKGLLYLSPSLIVYCFLLCVGNLFLGPVGVWLTLVAPPG